MPSQGGMAGRLQSSGIPHRCLAKVGWPAAYPVASVFYSLALSEGLVTAPIQDNQNPRLVYELQADLEKTDIHRRPDCFPGCKGVRCQSWACAALRPR